jgi:regulator of sigma E protease
MDKHQMLDLFLNQDFSSLTSTLSTVQGLAMTWFDSIPSLLAVESAVPEPSVLAQWGTRLYNIMLVALGLGFVIFVHELGHFLAAKTFGVKCEKFYIGFDVPIKIGPIRLPSKLVHFQWGETEYGIGAIPLGGYVKMLGQDDDPRRAEEEAKRIRTENPTANTDDPDRIKLDPRSFPAKSVGARMVIISAGVVMNLIFGVLMAAWAFSGSEGVPYEPAVVGEVLPGDPAWKNGIQPGDEVVQVDSLKDNELTFRDMFMSVLFHGLRDAKKELEIGLDRDGKAVQKKFLGTTVHSDPKRGLQHLTLGLRSAAIVQVGKKETVTKSIQLGFNQSEAYVPDLKANDKVTGINGTPLSASKLSDIPFEFKLNEKMHPRMHEKVTLQVERTEGDTKTNVDVEWPAIPMKSFGLRFKAGPVTAVLKESPASQAGIQEGDSLVAFNGAPIEDSFTLVLAAAAMHGKPASLTIEKADKSRVDLKWTIPDEFVVSTAEGTLAPLGLEIPGSGLVFAVSNIVSAIEPKSLAAKSGIAVDDVITQIEFIANTPTEKEYIKKVYLYGASELLKATPVDKSHNSQYFHNLAQNMREGMPVKVNFERDGKVSSAQLDIHVESDWFWPERGVIFTALKFHHKADSVATALGMGLSEIRRRMGNVLEFLELLVKGRMPFNVVGGPAMIAVEATDAASKGISPLLMFLVMLSANLAIVNFLPIPALDGGHMMFLIAEAALGKPVNEALQMKLTMIGVLGLLCLMGAVLINDSFNLTRIFGG